MRSQAGFAGQKDLYQVLHLWVYSDISPDEEHADEATAKKAA